MIIALLRVMILGLVRDRGALAMVFVLPPLIFMIFASIFSSMSGDGMRLKIAVLDQVNSTDSARLVSALEDEPTLRIDDGPITDDIDLRNAVMRADVDVGLTIRGDLGSDDPPILILGHGGREMAGSILAGHVQRLVAQKLPDINLGRMAPEIEVLAGGFTAQQDAALSNALSVMGESTESTSRNEEAGATLISVETLVPDGADTAVSYYAGAIAVLFLLLSAVHGAATLIEERASGIVDRLAISRAGIDLVVVSKFLFLLLQGVFQVGLIFLIARLIYGVDISEKFGLWFLVTVLASAAAAGLGMTIAAACSTKQQANTISGFFVLVISAIGGSMVPRFMMPPWLQDLGWYTPNAWAIEAYQGLLWREADLNSLAPSIWPLVVLACLGLGAAVALSRYRLRSG